MNANALLRCALLLVSCAAGDVGAAMPTGRTGPRGPTCIDTDQMTARRPAGPDALAFSLSNDRRVIVTTDGACSHLADVDRSYVLEFERREGSKLCRGDRLRVVDPVAVRAGGASGMPYCRITAIDRVR